MRVPGRAVAWQRTDELQHEGAPVAEHSNVDVLATRRMELGGRALCDGPVLGCDYASHPTTPLHSIPHHHTTPNLKEWSDSSTDQLLHAFRRAPRPVNKPARNVM